MDTGAIHAGPEQTLRVAEARLSETWKTSVELQLAENLSRDEEKLFLLADVRSQAPEAPAWVFVKRTLCGGNRPYDPELDGRRGVTTRFFNDWAGHQFLSRIDHDPPLAPRFYAGD